RAVEINPHSKSIRFSSGRREHYEVLASSIPLPVLAKLVVGAPSAVLDAADRLRATQLTCVNLIIDRPALTDCHWFYLYDDEIDAARVSVPGNLSPTSVPPGRTALQAEIFSLDGETPDPKSAVKRTVLQLSKLLRFDPREVVEAGHVFVPRAYVISDHAR